jgi:hypothetical protein
VVGKIIPDAGIFSRSIGCCFAGLGIAVLVALCCSSIANTDPAMTGLTNVDLDADLGSAPSILRLFASPGENQSSGLSSWDAAFLKALYQSNPTSRTRRFEITERVTHDISR